MSKLTKRSTLLSLDEQKAFLRHHLPGRIAMLKSSLGDSSYSSMLVAAIVARALASFLGIGRSKGTGKLFQDTSYFEHESAKSFEVKISDLKGGKLVDPTSLSDEVKKAISEGIMEANVAFAHLTFWRDATDQNPDSTATERYKKDQQQRIERFARAIIDLWNRSSADIKLT